MNPPLRNKQAIRRQKRRIGSSGETKPEATYKCRSCTQTGHNRTLFRRHANPAARNLETIFGHADDLSDAVGSMISVPLVATNFDKADTTLSKSSAVDPFLLYSIDGTTCSSLTFKVRNRQKTSISTSYMTSLTICTVWNRSYIICRCLLITCWQYGRWKHAGCLRAFMLWLIPDINHDKSILQPAHLLDKRIHQGVSEVIFKWAWP